MALITQIRLPSITGSVGTSGGPWPGDVQQANLAASTPLDSVVGTGISTILQGFADAIGKIQGDTDWTNATVGRRFAATAGGGYDLQSDQLSGNRGNNLFSSGSMKISKIGSGNPLEIRTGDGLGLLAGGIEISSQARLQLSASNLGNDAVKVLAPGGGLQVDVGKKIHLDSATGGIMIESADTTNQVRVSSAALNSSIVLSASIGFANDFDSTKNSQISIFAKQGIDFYSSGSLGSADRWGVIGPQTPPSGEGWFQVAGTNQSLRLGAEADGYGSAAGGRLYLSGANSVFFADAQTCTETGGMDMGFGPGSWALSTDGEMTTYVSNFNNSTSLVGALNSLKSSISSTEGSIHRKKMSAPLLANANVDVGAAEAGTPTDLRDYATNTVQVMLNGQLLVSASGADSDGAGAAANVPANGDYYIVGNGRGNDGLPANTLRFGFDLEADDQIQVWNLA